MPVIFSKIKAYIIPSRVIARKKIGLNKAGHTTKPVVGCSGCRGIMKGWGEAAENSGKIQCNSKEQGRSSLK